MMVEIDYDIADEIARQVLVETYVNLTNDIKNNKNIDEEDLEMYKEVVAAIEVLSKWFFYDFELDVKNYKKRKIK